LATHGDGDRRAQACKGLSQLRRGVAVPTLRCGVVDPAARGGAERCSTRGQGV